ncbi:uncharacterized protein LOC121754477 [Salvia splendens]|uniref:uncharacterized protein LOC121754477 n=1 Tax=Salvia splendens TaxID=180675 RepID=UPI001C255BA9|nr:uncharacterized protein LOC121754477 [Salvia splendens]
MAMARFETEKFNGLNDFGLWQIKMRALLTHQGLDEALEEGEKDDKSDAQKIEILKKAKSVLILNLDDKVLREVAREESAAAIWKKLEDLYMTKSLANRLYLKQRLYSFRFNDDKPIGDQLDQFNKILDDIENVDAKMEEEDKAIALLNALPKSFEHFKEAMLYGREKSITLMEVLTLQEESVHQILNVVAEQIGEAWIIDYGCNFHVSSHKQWFEDFKASNGSVILGNNQTCLIRGMRNIRMRFADGSMILLTDVRFIPEIKRNLVSLGLLETKGYGFRSEGGRLVIYKGSKTVMSAEKRQTFYYLEASVVTGSTNVAEKQIGVHTWHMRMGHLGTKGMLRLANKGVFKMGKEEDLSKCCSV